MRVARGRSCASDPAGNPVPSPPFVSVAGTASQARNRAPCGRTWKSIPRRLPGCLTDDDRRLRSPRKVEQMLMVVPIFDVVQPAGIAIGSLEACPGRAHRHRYERPTHTETVPARFVVDREAAQRPSSRAACRSALACGHRPLKSDPQVKRLVDQKKCACEAGVRRCSPSDLLDLRELLVQLVECAIAPKESVSWSTYRAPRPRSPPFS